jgi:polyhydroxyalkanoate synthase
MATNGFRTRRGKTTCFIGSGCKAIWRGATASTPLWTGPGLTTQTPRARFALSLLTEAVAPTNFLLGNPAALKKMMETGGASLIRGLQNLLQDIATNGGMPAQVDKSAFQVGKNLAATPGAVVFRNDVCELIQYAPATDQVYARPLLFVAPQINKFYILDQLR